MKNMKRKLILITFVMLSQLVALPVSSEVIKDDEVATSVSSEDVANDLLSHSTKYLEILKADKEKRKVYIEAVYSNLQLEKQMKDKKIDQDPNFLLELKKFKIKTILDSLVISKLEEEEADVETLADERYQFGKEKYKTKKEIKIAVIYVAKKNGDNQKERKKIDDILNQLQEKAKSGNLVAGFDLFSELAKKYSDDKNAKKGGFNDQWIVIPEDIDQRSELIKKVFSLNEYGEVTDVIESEEGFQIFKLMAIKNPTQQSFEQVKTLLIQEIRRELWDSKLAEVTKSALPSKEVRESINDILLEKIVTGTLKSRLEKSK